MQFEKVRIINKRKIIIGGLISLGVISTLIYLPSKAKYRTTENFNIVNGTINYKVPDFKMIAMYSSEDGSNYTEIIGRMPEDYIINEEKSYCTIDNNNRDNEVKLYTKNGEHLFKNLKKSDKCYIYFDKYRNEQTALGTLKVNYSKPNFSQAATTDEGIFGVYDEVYNGTSYYWRGAATTNYLKFAGYCWRIVRINGDGSIRLIYDGEICHANGEATTDSIAVQNVRYNEEYDQSNYAGWTYEGTLQRPTDNAAATSSNAKAQLENWYNTNITGTNAAKVAQGKYCNDRNAQSGNSWTINGSKFYYATHMRTIMNYQPTLSCPSKDTYTLNVGLITADEVSFAGGNTANNSSYYLHNEQNYWTMSPFDWDGGVLAFFVSSNSSLYWAKVDFPIGLRPVINLKSDTAFSSGDGTIESPFTVK